MSTFTKILAQVRGGDLDQAALRRAARLAAGGGAAVTIVDAVEDLPWYTRLLLSEPDAQMASVVRDRGQTLEALAAPGRRSGVEVDTKILRGRIDTELVREIQRDGFDLLVKEADPGWNRNFGPTDTILLRTSPCPVWLEAPSARGAPIARVLAPIDPTPESLEPIGADDRRVLNDKVLRLAQAIARDEGAELHVVHAWSAPAEGLLRNWVSDMPNPYTAYVEQSRHAADQALGEVLERHPCGPVPRQVHLLQGDCPDEVVARFADEQGIDLIVMGTSARTGLAAALFGSTAESILNQVACSVLAVKPDRFVSSVPPDDQPDSTAPAP